MSDFDDHLDKLRELHLEATTGYEEHRAEEAFWRNLSALGPYAERRSLAWTIGSQARPSRPNPLYRRPRERQSDRPTAVGYLQQARERSRELERARRLEQIPGPRVATEKPVENPAWRRRDLAP